MALETVSTNKSHGGIQGVYRHHSAETKTDMTFSVFVPPQAEAGAKLPVVWYLSGLTCTHANVTEKGEYRRACAELGLVFVAPDTSPRGPDVPKIVDWYMNGKIAIDPMITHLLSLEEINKGFDLMHAGESIRSVVVY